jgi:HSP20 family protein
MNPRARETAASHRSAPEQTRTERAVTPAVDIWESETALRIVADLPGVKRDDLRLHLEAERLSLEARRAQSGEPPVVYRRQFALAPLFDAEQVTAALDRGVLTITLPKSKSSQPRQIPITVG